MAVYREVEPVAIAEFRAWLTQEGGYMQPGLFYYKDHVGTSIRTNQDLPCETTVLACPFSLAITAPLAEKALVQLLGPSSETLVQSLNERELVCTYISLHWVVLGDKMNGQQNQKHAALQHLPYLETLPTVDEFRTPLFWTKEELFLIEGTNLYHAAIDRKSDWEKEWLKSQQVVQQFQAGWITGFTWEVKDALYETLHRASNVVEQRFQAAGTYLSSRAFPSSLLSSNPSLQAAESSHQILLPAIDSLNHARGGKVTWSVSKIETLSKNQNAIGEMQISLVLNSDTAKGREVFNNYGLKSNAELILGYGFTLENNPEDVLVFKLGGKGAQGAREEVGRNAVGFDNVYQNFRQAFLASIQDDEEPPEDWEVSLEVADRLKELVGIMTDKLEATAQRISSTDRTCIRQDVFEMIDDYVKGQMDIARSVQGEVDKMWSRAVQEAKESGVEFGSDFGDS